MPPPTRYRFADFLVSPRRRVLLRAGCEVPLIPRYFDLLVLLLERRRDAVHRQDIFTCVWRDVIVSDGALSQAVRTLRRALGDESRDPTFIRTVARHGYRFVFPDVVEEPDEGEIAIGVPTGSSPGDPPRSGSDPRAGIERLLDRLTAPSRTGQDADDEADRRDMAEQLHALGTADVLAHLDGRPPNPRALALLRDARWDVPGAGDVPLLGRPGGSGAALVLVAMRARRAWRVARDRWIGAAAGTATAGAAAGAIGGLTLVMMPAADAPAAAIAVLAAIGAMAGAAGGAGIGAGLGAAEALARSRRAAALVAGGAAGGAAAASLSHALLRWTLEVLFGVTLPAIAGPLDGLVLGAAAGLGYAIAAPRPAGGGMACPRGRDRLVAAAVVAACCALAALGLAASGRPLAGGTVNEIARASRGSQIALSPLGRLIGEPDFGPLTSTLIGSLEGAMFGLGLTLGLTRRPRA